MRFFIVSLLFFLVSFHGRSQFSIQGRVTDSSTQEPLIGATVFFKNQQKGTVTNLNGEFELKNKAGSYQIVVSFLGYATQEMRVELTQNMRISFELQPTAIQQKEVVVSAEAANKNVADVQMGAIELEMKEVEKLPAFLGEIDVLKTIQLLPGVQSAGDGNSGLYIRGGGPDQNLILYDGATLYNASHLFGFFSVFNPDFVEKVELTKGNMPAEYGGRLASVIDIESKTGNMNQLKGTGGIGLISSRLALEGPLQKGKSSFFVAGRRTYIDILTRPLIPDDSEFSGSAYYFYDVNAKLSFKLKDNSLLEVNTYLGRDVFDLSGAGNFNARIPWGNNIAGLKWNKVISRKMAVKLSAYYTEYQFEFGADQSDFELNLFSGIEDIQVAADFSYRPTPLHHIKFGGRSIYHQFTPSNVSARSGETELDIESIRQLNAIESSAYLQDEIDLSTDLSINAGLRFSNFTQLGPFTRFREDELGNPIDTTSYQSGESVVSYNGLAPRITLRYQVGAHSSVKAAYTRNYQFVHLANFSTLSLPTDLWLPSSDRVKPQVGDQYSIGFFKNWKNNTIESSAEVYYRTMENMVEYREGALPADDVGTNPDNSLVRGRGWSYGVELFVKKKFGKLNGWVGYTWSKTMREFEAINNGKPYAAPYDRRHDLSIVGIFDYSEKWSFGATFVYGTGNAITLPVSRYSVEGRIVDVYAERNDYRMPSYHRLDLSATMQGKKREKWQSKWIFALYNAYSRLNPFFLYIANEGEISSGEVNIQAKQVSLFPVLPSVTYNFSF